MTYELSGQDIEQYTSSIGADALPDRSTSEQAGKTESYNSDREVETLLYITKTTSLLDRDDDSAENINATNKEITREVGESFHALSEELVSQERAITESLYPLRSVDRFPLFADIEKEKRDVLSDALKVVCKKLNAQVAAIFLTNKDGFLERASLFGIDRNGEIIDPNWYSHESYKVNNESLVGRTALAEKGAKFGRVQHSDNLEKENNVDSISKAKYLEKFGFFGRAIAVPIDGRNRTYGVLRILNVVNPNTNEISGPEVVTKEDVIWLSLLGKHISNALSNFRRDLQTKITAHLNYRLANPSNNTHSYKDALHYYREAVDLLVNNSETAFKAGVLRLVDDSTQLLKVVVSTFIASSNVNRDDRPIEIGERLIAGSVASKKEGLITIDLSSTKLRNEKWIASNDLKTLCCFPLVSRGKLFGTLSLYTSYQYDYHIDSINFLKRVSESIATYTLLEFSEDKARLKELLDACDRIREKTDKESEKENHSTSVNVRNDSIKDEKETGAYRFALPGSANDENRRLFYEGIDVFCKRHPDWLIFEDRLRFGEETAFLLIHKEDKRLTHLAAQSTKDSFSMAV